jgi:lipopolysaccharide biosynthesis glycosyltransferase
MIKNPIVIISDDNYFIGSCVLIKSIVDKHNGKGLAFYIVHDKDKMSENTKNIFINMFPDIEILFYTSSKYEIFKKNIEDGYSKDYNEKKWNTSIWLQVFISDAIPDTIDKVIYMDSDTFFLESPEPIFDFILKMPIAAQIDYGSGNYNAHGKYPYFNAGFFITSLKYWRDINLVDLFLDNIKDNHYEFHGQDFLNDIFKNNWQILGPQINVAREAIALQDYLKSKNDIYNINNFIFHDKPINIHFLGSPKPWTKEYFDNSFSNWRIFNSLGSIDYIYKDLADYVKSFTLNERSTEV